MMDQFDYLEPACPLCDGASFYARQEGAPLGRIPVARVIDKLDALFAVNDYVAAGKLLTYWRDEAVALRDTHGELAIVNELVGYYRKQNAPVEGLAAVERSLALVDALEQGEGASGATILINCATAYKAFGMAERALPLYRRAEEIYQTVLRPGDARFGALYNNMALALADLGRCDAAEEAYRSALAVMEQVEGGEAECAITYINLAHMYETTHPEQIDACLRRAYELLKSECLSHDGYYAFVLEKCAPSFGYFGNTEICEELTEESRRIYAGT